MAAETERIHLSVSACLIGAMLLLFLPLDWILAFCTAALLHELGHLTAIWLLGGSVLQLRIGGDGMVIETEPLGAKQELIAAAAGPITSLALLLLCRQMPRLAICGGIQGLYNLMPLYPLDGGRMLSCTLGRIRNGEQACRIVECSFLGLLGAGVAGLCIMLRTGILPMLTVLLFFGFRIRRSINFPCKLAHLKVQ